MMTDYGPRTLQKQFNQVVQHSERRLSHRVFTDSTEKQAVEQLIEQYINQQKACNNSDLSETLFIIHNNKNTVIILGHIINQLSMIKPYSRFNRN